MMMQTENFSLKKFNTFGLEAKARHYFSFSTQAELISFLEKDFDKGSPFLILGGGSNLLFTKDFAGTVIHPLIDGISIISEDDNTVTVTVGAGVEWDSFVEWSVENNFHGVENLSLIPGNIGASPVQNIGAYGAEAKDVITEVHTVEIANAQARVFTSVDCKFAYRNSVFKQEQANKQIVCSVVFTLQKQAEFNIEYGSIQAELEKEAEITLKTIRKVIVDIRESKLPNPELIGNAGSFFKNPVISKEHFEKVKLKFPEVVSYKVGEDVKIAAGWLLDTLGFKGFSVGGAKVHDKQALVLTNTGTATGADIVALSETIQKKVYKETGIELEAEVIFL